MAHFWHDLGKAFCLRAVMMVLGDKLRATSIAEVAFLYGGNQMKILVLKTDCLLDQDTKENLREEARKAVQTGIMILDRGTSLEVIEIDKSALLDEKGIAASFEQAMKKVGEMTVDGKYVPYEERKIDKDDLVWDKERGVYILQKGNMK
ncbi:hypothetical protein [Bacillus safensis]|uniref:hypothetical protein n=2 Tax=Bacillus safensis TaxID=561879 RepID=UPI002E2488C8|nr:hypothetical protein [Bacillus safensis]